MTSYIETVASFSLFTEEGKIISVAAFLKEAAQYCEFGTSKTKANAEG